MDVSSPATKSRISPARWRRPRRLERRYSPDHTQRTTATRLSCSSRAAISQKSTTCRSRHAEVDVMRIALVWLAVWFVVASSVHAQPVPAYSLLRENEDWSFLRDTSLRQDIWDPLKYIGLGSDDWYLTIGGEVREVFEQAGNDNWGKQRYTNADLRVSITETVLRLPLATNSRPSRASSRSFGFSWTLILRSTAEEETSTTAIESPPQLLTYTVFSSGLMAHVYGLEPTGMLAMTRRASISITSRVWLRFPAA